MKRFPILALSAALCLGGFALSPCHAGVSGNYAPTEDDTPTDHVGLARALLAEMQEITDILSEVKDKESAFHASCRIPSRIVELKSLLEATDKLGKPSRSEQAELEAMEDEYNAAVEAMMKAIIKVVEKDCYGEENLERSLQKLE